MKQSPELPSALELSPLTSSKKSRRPSMARAAGCASWFAQMLPLLLLVGVFAVNGFPQSDNSQISGFVKDPSGAVVTGAKVVVRSESKGLERVVSTNSQGYYVVSPLPSDVY